MEHRFFPSLIHTTAALAVCALVLAPNGASAGVLFKTGLAYLSGAEAVDRWESTTTRQMIDVSAGYAWDNGIVVHGHYGTEQRSDTRKYEPTNLDSTEKSSRTSMGVGGGWKGKGNIFPYLLATYFPTTDFTRETRIYKGSGYQAELGIAIEVKKVSVAFQGTYRHFKYNAYDSGEALAFPNTSTTVDPGIAVFIEF